MSVVEIPEHGIVPGSSSSLLINTEQRESKLKEEKEIEARDKAESEKEERRISSIFYRNGVGK